MELPLYKEFTKEQLEEYGPQKEALEYKTFMRVYETPFIYENLEVSNFCEIGTDKGIEFKADDGYITIVEDKPITAVTVAGSGCTRGGYNIVEWWDEDESIDEMKDQLVKRQRIDNLHGMHPSVYTEIFRNSACVQGLWQGKPITQPNISEGAYKDDVGMVKYHSSNYYEPFDISLYENTAYFSIGRADKRPKKVTIRAGCKGTEEPGTKRGRYPGEYAIRLVEVTLIDV